MEAIHKKTDSESQDLTQSSPDPETKSDEIPDGGYGWVIVAAVFWNNAHGWGITGTYSVFLAYYLQHSTIPNATALDFAFIGSLCIAQGLIIAPLASNITRLYNTTASMLLGVFCETIGLIGASLSKETWHLYLSFICMGWGVGLQYVAAVGVIPQWFSKRRGLASGTGAAGSGTGGVIYTLAANAMIDRFGVSWTYGMLCITQFVVNTTCAILIRNRNRKVGAKQVAVNLGLFRRYEYWLLLFWGFFSILGFLVLLFCLPDYASSIGLTASQGATAAAIFNVGQAFGRPVMGYYADAVGRINMASIMSLLCGVFCFAIWIPARDFGVLIPFSLLGGAVAGSLWTIAAPVATEVIGLQDLPSGMTMMWVILAVPATFAAPIALQLRKPGSSTAYLDPQLFTGFMFVGAGLSAFLLRIWKIWQQDEIARLGAVQPGEDTVTPTSAPPGTTSSASSGSITREGYLKSLRNGFMLRKV